MEDERSVINVISVISDVTVFMNSSKLSLEASVSHSVFIMRTEILTLHLTIQELIRMREMNACRIFVTTGKTKT
jgi:hypothetical protein